MTTEFQVGDIYQYNRSGYGSYGGSTKPHTVLILNTYDAGETFQIVDLDTQSTRYIAAKSLRARHAKKISTAPLTQFQQDVYKGHIAKVNLSASASQAIGPLQIAIRKDVNILMPRSLKPGQCIQIADKYYLGLMSGELLDLHTFEITVDPLDTPGIQRSVTITVGEK